MVIIDLPAGVTTFNKFLDVKGFGDSGSHVVVWDTDLMASGEYFITRSQTHESSSDFAETTRLSVGAGKTYLGIELDLRSYETTWMVFQQGKCRLHSNALPFL